MNNITPEIVRNLLDALVTPKFDIIVDYNITTRQTDGGKVGVGVDVIMKHKLDITTDIEYAIERRVRGAMKYFSPSFVVVDFYVTEDY